MQFPQIFSRILWTELLSSDPINRNQFFYALFHSKCPRKRIVNLALQALERLVLLGFNHE